MRQMVVVERESGRFAEAEIGEDHFHDWNQHALDLWNQMEPDHRAQSPLNVATPDSSANVGPR